MEQQADSKGKVRGESGAGDVCPRANTPRGAAAILTAAIERLEREQLSVIGGCSQLEWRRGWNAATAHMLGWLRVEAGLAELAAAECWSRFDLGGEA